MGARLPRTEGRDRSTTEFGIAALDARLEDADVSYPVSDTQLVQALDDPAIPIDVDGRTAPLSEIVEDVDSEQFESEQEVLNALHPAFEAKRAASRSNVFDAVRSMLPF